MHQQTGSKYRLLFFNTDNGSMASNDHDFAVITSQLLSNTAVISWVVSLTNNVKLVQLTDSFVTA